jgi:phosphatidylserine decarboxylase
MNPKLFVGLQYLLPQHGLTSVVYSLARSRVPLVKNALISSFVRHFKPELSDAVEPNALAYASFNDFFTRALRPGARPADADPTALVSPVDGTISQIGTLDGTRLLQAKGLHYTVESLLDGHDEHAARFAGGAFTTIYLAPYNYHRVHMPLPGRLREAWYVPGDLFSVNTTTAASVAGLFARNERVVCIFDHGPLSFALILVGALFVGSMATVWHGDITPRRPRRAQPLAADPALSPLGIERGAEMGRFNKGSTVILLLPPGTTRWLPAWEAGSAVRVGQALARMS